MPSQFFGLNIAYTGLLSANAALNTTGNNISNVETKGYSRQQVVTQAASALRVFTTYGCAGAGVDTLAIERIRNEFYDYKYWNNNTKLGEYDIKQYYMKQIENYLMDDPDKGINGFNTIFEDMYDALAEVMKNGGDTATKGQFIGWANSLTDYFNDTATNLQEMQKDINLEIKNKVDEINSIAQEISTINKQINVVETSGITANELRDKRALLIDQLSAIVDVEVTETPILDSNNPTRITGATNFKVKIAGGQTLVDTDRYNKLVCMARKEDEKVNQSDADGLYEIAFESSGLELNLYGGNFGGELKSLVQMRDGNNGEYFNGTVAAGGVKNGVVINGEQRTTVTIDVKADYLKDINKSSLSDTGGYIRLGNQEFKYDSWTMTTTIAADGTQTTSYEFVMSKDNERMPDASRVGKDASVGSKVSYQGIPYYQQQLNEWSRTFAECFNNILTQDGATNSYGANNNYLFVSDSRDSSDQLKFAEHKWVEDGMGNKTLTVSTSSDSYYKLTAMNFGINNDLIKDAGLLATHTGGVDEKDKYNIVEELIALKTDKDKMSFRNSSAGQFLECLQSDIALNAQSANVFYSNYSNISHSIEVQRTSVSGVDNDEEALNLVKYQNAYNLASKMVQTLTEVYDRLILQTGV